MNKKGNSNNLKFQIPILTLYVLSWNLEFLNIWNLLNFWA